MKRLFRFRKAFAAVAAVFLGLYPSQSVWSQDDNSGKLSTTTQMFLSELNGTLSLERDTKAERELNLLPLEVDSRLKGKNAGRIYAAPDTINGRAYIAAFVRVSSGSGVSELENEGVIVQEQFDNGLLTTLIPVDKIGDVAAIGSVSRINVSPLMQPATHIAREKTNVDDVLTQSSDAVSAGLKQIYDGKGVVMGVIDDGIDFQHIAFKDANGNSRIKRAYVYDGSSAKEYTSITSSSPTTDDSGSDHGTHTSTTAGGSSVIVSGSTVTVTSDHSKATYGGMAPGSDLYLAGVKDLYTTYITNAFKKICDYADSQNQPVVISNSWGSQMGPHDGTGDMADVINQYFGDSHPNHIALFASSNDGGKPKDGEGGGYHLTGTASSSSPLGGVLRSSYYSNTDAGYYYYGTISNAWARSSSVSSLSCKIYVLNASTGTVLTTVSVSPTSSGSQVSGLSSYYSGTLVAYKDYISSNKTQILLYTSGLTSRSTSQTTKDGSTYYKSNYTLAVEFYPSSGSSAIDVWGGNYCYLTDYLSTSGHSWKAGTDDGCVSDEATMTNVIPIGAYVSANTWTDYNGTSHDMSSTFTMGDIAYFSSWQTANGGPSGTMIPWITAPGARLAAGVNHYSTSYTTGSSKEDRVNANTTYPYAMMQGTSMATPTAAGIVALWLQAAKEVGKELTVNDVKEIMKETAINDSYTTTGANKDHFGNGKIDALAGVKYILGAVSEPTIKTDVEELSFEGYTGETHIKTVSVTGLNLEGNVTISKSGADVFTVDKTEVSQTSAESGTTITVTWKPVAAGTQTGTVTLSSPNAGDVVVSLTGTAEVAVPTLGVDKESIDFAARLDTEVSKTLSVNGSHLSGDVKVVLNDENGVFGVSATTLAASDVEEGAAIDVTFQSAAEGNFTASLLISSEGAETIEVALTAKARDGGTASDSYLNVANYATIDDAGWNTSYVNNLYKYTEYPNDEVAWLTLPVYGAWVGVYYNSHPQQWIESSLTTSNAYAGVKWTYTPTSTNPYNGSSAYFTSTTARVMGYNSSNNTTKKAVSFYVTNATAVKALGLGASKASSTYPAALRVYECTLNDDGTLTAATTAAKNATSASTSTSTTFTLDITGLDASKIYKVEASVYRGYIYEIGFQTPIEAGDPELIADPTDLTFDEIEAGKTTTQTFDVLGTALKGDVTLTLNDASGVFSLDETTVSKADAQAGKTVTVTFAPQEKGDYTGTVTVSSTGVEDITVTLNATAQRATPDYFDVTISSAGLTTLYLDFPVEIPYDTYDPDLLGVFYIYGLDGTEMKAARLNTIIPAYTGVIIQGNSGTYRFPKSAQPGSLKYSTLLSGSTETITVKEALEKAGSTGTVMTLGRGSDSYINFYRYSGKTLAAYKAFFIYEGGVGVSSLSIGTNGGATGIRSLDADDGNQGWYTVQGQKLNGTPTRKGVYIHNGKAVTVR